MADGRFRTSRYNFFYELEEGRELAYNALCNALLVLPTAIAQRLRELESAAGFTFDEVPPQVAAAGFVVPEHVDELLAIRKQSRSIRDSAESLGLTIAPTLACNFGCPYCFQEHPRSYMPPDVQQALVRFIDAHCPTLRFLGVTWFGGEPILAIKVVHRLSQEFSRLADARGFQFTPAAMITNGWGLTAENCALLAECNIDRIQFTIDGVGDVHNRRRMLVDGRATFDRIVANLGTALELLPNAKFTVRVNLERENADALQEVAEYVAARGMTERVHVYPGHVEPYTANSRTVDVLSDQEFYEIRGRHDRYRVSVGRSPAQLPTIRADSYCCATHRHSFVITPSGSMFKCWNETGGDESRTIGNLLDDTTPLVTRPETEYDAWDITQDPECAACKVLPLCGGGCVWRGMMAAQDFSRLHKIHSPYLFGDNLERAVRLQYEHHVRSRSMPAVAVSSIT